MKYHLIALLLISTSVSSWDVVKASQEDNRIQKLHDQMRTSEIAPARRPSNGSFSNAYDRTLIRQANRAAVDQYQRNLDQNIRVKRAERRPEPSTIDVDQFFQERK